MKKKKQKKKKPSGLTREQRIALTELSLRTDAATKFAFGHMIWPSIRTLTGLNKEFDEYMENSKKSIKAKATKMVDDAIKKKQGR